MLCFVDENDGHGANYRRNVVSQYLVIMIHVAFSVIRQEVIYLLT